MKLKIREDSTNYVASVVKIKEVLPIEGADKIGYVIVNGNPVIVQKSLDISKPVVYFTAGTELSHELCRMTNSYTSAEMNSDTKVKGFVELNRKVKIIKLRGVYSNGMILPLTFFPKGLEVGNEFNSIDGVEYCKKFFVPVKEQPSSSEGKKGKKVKKESRMIEGQFQFHISTSHLSKNLHTIKPDTLIQVSHKLHGTSKVLSNSLVKRKLTFLEKLAKKLGVKVNETEYDLIYASRTVIKNSALEKGYYNEDIWKVVKDEIGYKIPKGVSVYGEIVGYTPSGSAIQKGYDYGCSAGKHKFMVYRMTTTNIDGRVLEWSPIQIKEFCDFNGLLFSDYQIFYGKAKDFIGFSGEGNFEEAFYKFCVDGYTEKDCGFCKNKVAEEGIVVRVDSGFEYKAFKLKSQRFILGESKAQDLGEVSLEDES